MTSSKNVALLIVLALVAFLGIAAARQTAGDSGNSIAFPKDYRGWHHAKTMVIEAGHPLASPFEGLHNIYVNDKGLEAHKKAAPFPDGSILVFDLFETAKSDSAITTDKRKFVAVMVKDAAKYKETGGWGFERFDARFRPTHTDSKGCFQCHVSGDTTDFVLSRYVE
ncbi:MAG: cytochrome P460 family protein [Planctomycetota bacterium]